MPVKNSRVILLLLAVLALCAIAAADDLEKALNSQYKGQTYSLRYPLTKGSQEYDASGNLLTRGQNGPWTVFGRVRIKKVRLRRKMLVLETERVGYIFDRRQLRMMPWKVQGKVRIEINLNEPLASADQADHLLGNVFAFKREEFLASISPLWRDYVESRLETYSDDGRTLSFRAHKLVDPKARQRVVLEGGQATPEPNPDANGVYKVGKGVTAPVALRTPDPDYSEWARREKISTVVGFSVIIDEDGRISKIMLAQPAGYGLEEQAIESLKTWTFRPATKDNKPVKVQVYVEISFNLF